MTTASPAPAQPDDIATPTQAWQALIEGNRRFVQGAARNADQDGARRTAVAAGQKPFALIFGCSDSRVSAEIVFDQGLGRLFVVRTAGQVTDSGVLGSIEFGVQALSVPLIVVLGHDRCGAVAATISALESGELPGGFIRDIVERVMPSALVARQAGHLTPELVEAEHVRQTARLLADRSGVVAEAIAQGRCAVVGLVYDLNDGAVRLVETIGAVQP